MAEALPTAPSPTIPGVLREAARAVQASDDARHYLDHPPPDRRWGVHVSWTWGSGCDAHKALQPLIAAKVEALMPRLLQEAAADLARHADLRVAEVEEALRGWS